MKLTDVEDNSEKIIKRIYVYNRECMWKSLVTLGIIAGGVAYCWTPIAEKCPPNFEGLAIITIIIWIFG